MCYTSPIYPQEIKDITAKGDSAALSHYWRDEDAQCWENVKLQLEQQVTLPNNSSIQATKQGHTTLDPSVTVRVTSSEILSSLKSASLISLGQLCDDACQLLLDKNKLIVTKNNNKILYGDRN